MKQRELLKELLKWKEENIITQEQYLLLKDRYSSKEEKQPKIYTKVSPQKILIFFSVVIVVLGILSLIGQKVAVINDIVVFCSLIFFIIGILYFGDYLTDRKLKVVKYLGKAVILIACFLTTFLVFYIDIKLSSRLGIKLLGNDWAAFILIGSFILIPVAYKTREKTILGYSLAALLIWFISEGKIRSGAYTYNWLGMTFPVRMIVFSLIFIMLGYLHNNKFKNLKRDLTNYKAFTNTYYGFGLLIFFIPSWIASTGGWLVNPAFPIKFESFFFVLLTLLASIYVIYLGLIRSNKQFFNIGLTFFLLEIYTKLYTAICIKYGEPLFYIIVIVIGVAAAVLAEYIIRYKEQLKEELLKGNKG